MTNDLAKSIFKSSCALIDDMGKTTFTNFYSAKQYIEELNSTGLKWNEVGFLSDADHHNLLTLLFLDNKLIDVFRFSFTDNDNHSFIKFLNDEFVIDTEYRISDTKEFVSDDINYKEQVKELWDASVGSKYPLDKSNLDIFVGDLILKNNDGGRGVNFTVDTIRRVMDDSHGRCMFRGCGKRLDVDDLTGYEGNYSYLAHNIASSTKGPRGELYLSHLLSNDPENILLLCDVHHRLVDKVATSNYPASLMKEMRQEHVDLCNSLLDSLSYTPVDIFFIPWGVNSQHVEKPDKISVSRSLAGLQLRPAGDFVPVPFGKDETFDNDNSFEEGISKYIRKCVDKIQDTVEGNPAAVFVLGPTFALIGFGAKFGNKSKLMPMLRYRDASSWIWPSSEAREDAFTIEQPVIDEKTTEVVLSIKLTADAPQIDKTIEDINKRSVNEAQVIDVSPSKKYDYGNGAIAHPLEGEKLSNDLKKILTDLKEVHHIEKVHLLVCASNAACVYIGQAIDRFQPECIVYDFGSEMMAPKIRIYNDGNATVVEYVDLDNVY